MPAYRNLREHDVVQTGDEWSLLWTQSPDLEPADTWFPADRFVGQPVAPLLGEGVMLRRPVPPHEEADE